MIQLQEKLKENGKVVSLGEFKMAEGVDENLLCRLMGPVKVAPGKSLTEYIKDAFQEELFLAQVYATDAPTVINGTINEISFSSISPAYWEIGMTVSSNNSSVYDVSTKYEFNTSFSAYSACKNVADAFSPAVQSLLREVVSNPQFVNLVE